MTGPSQGLQHQSKLNGRDVLHLVDDDEIVTWCGPGQPILGDQIQVEQPGFGEPSPVFVENVIEGVAPLSGENGLTHTQRPVLFARQHTGGPGGNHAANLLESLVAVDVP